MLPVVVEFVFLAAVIVVAGTFLSRSADTIAEVTGFGRLLVGSVLLAGATSLPELTVDISAVRLGLPNLAAGDLLGSSLMNLLILAALDLSMYSRGKMLSRASAGHALSAIVSMALTSWVGLAILTAGSLPVASLWEISLPTWGLVVGYLLGVRMVFLDQRLSMLALEASQAAKASPPTQSETQKPPLWKPAGIFLTAALVLVLTGPRLAKTAGGLAEISGLGNTFVGTTLVALSTSLPELVSTLVALRMNAVDLAIGNIFGSNTFNMLVFVPLDALHQGSIFASLSASHVVTCLAVIMASTIAVMGQLYGVEKRKPILEPDAWLVVVVIIGALFLVYRLS